MSRWPAVAGLAMAAVWLWACSGVGGHEAGGNASGGHEAGGLMHMLRKHESSNDNGGLRIDAAFDNDSLVRVELKGHAFAIRSRQAALDKFPCVRCHKVPLAQMKHDEKDGKKKAHWNVALKHSDEQTMGCSTCHLEGDLNSLRSLANKPVALDESYKVCAQCHSKQASDWAGGAHGKRVGGWAPPRVSRTCAECHNPHAPAFDPRYPALVMRREDKVGHE